METALLIDIGSTYTKVALIDLANAVLLDRNQAFTTIESGVNIGLRRALDTISNWQQARYKLASSSAAGGLKIIAVGLVPELTAEAARRAALGAGSKVLKTYSFQLNSNDIQEIEEAEPDIILLSGGTDGGNQKNIIFNAGKLAESTYDKPVIVAGNRNAVDEVMDILKDAGKEVYITENVMPELEKLNIEPAHQLIREIFLNRIIKARGLSAVNEIIDGIIMPTPSAVMKAAELLSAGYGAEEGLGELMVLDIGGATTDVHSAASGEPGRANVSWRGLEEPYIKRTVEGDLGMRYSLPTLYSAVDKQLLEREIMKKEKEEGFFHNDSKSILDYCQKIVEKLNKNPGQFSEPEERIIENILAYFAAMLAVERHVGRLKTVYTPMGSAFIQEGKDLTGIKHIIGTGGIIVSNSDPQYILSAALFKNQQNPELLAPVEAELLVDSEYIMAAAGLLAGVEPEISCRLMKKYIKL